MRARHAAGVPPHGSRNMSYSDFPPSNRPRCERRPVQPWTGDLQPHRQSDPGMRRLTERASTIVRETNYFAVDEIAGDRGPDTALLEKKLASMTEARDVVAAMTPPKGGGAITPATLAPRARKGQIDEAFFKPYIENDPP